MSQLDQALAQMDEDPRLEAPDEETPDGREDEAPEPVAEEQSEPEPEQPEPEEPEPATDPRVQSYLDKYSGDVDKALAAAVEAQELIGRQGGEVGELRRTVAELQERVEAQAREPQQTVSFDQNTVNWFDTLTEEDPHRAAAWALQNDPSGLYYNQAMEAWYEQNPRQASAFERQLELGQLRQQFETQLAEQTQPLVAQARDSSIAQAWALAQSQLPDLNEQREQVLAAAQAAPEIAEKVVTGTPEERQEGIRTLYFLAKGMQSATLETETQRASEEQRSAARAAKADGTAATQTTAVNAEKVSEEERWLREHFDPHAKKFYADK